MLTLTYSGLTVQYANIIFIAIVLKILKLTINVSQGFYRGHGNGFFAFSNLFQAAENFGKEVESHILLTSGAHNQRNDKISNEVGRGC